MILETMSSGLTAKLVVVLLGVAMVSEVIDLQSLPPLGIITTACVFAYRTVAKAKNDAVAEYAKITVSLREELERKDEQLAYKDTVIDREREENARLRSHLQDDTDADDG